MILFGLGNPGRKYHLTRHNIGFLVLDKLAKDLGVKFKSHPDYKEAFSERYNLFLVKPLLYMNNSGVIVNEYLKKRKDDFLVICDDIYLPYGEIRFKKKGSDGGHRGLANIIYYLQTQNFLRLRVGIGMPVVISYTDYVLSEFTKKEKETLPLLLKKIATALGVFLEKGIDWAMTQFNRKKLLVQ